MKTTIAAVLSATLLTAGCTDPAPPAAPTLAAPSVTETFQGTLLIASTNTHQFAVTKAGGLRVSLTDLVPGAVVRLGVGTPGAGTCIVSSTTLAAPGVATQMSGSATVTGNFCVAISDVGNLVEPVTYTITVVHS